MPRPLVLLLALAFFVSCCSDSTDPAGPWLRFDGGVEPLPMLGGAPFAIGARTRVLLVRRGRTASLSIRVVRAEGFTSPIEIRTSGLPPQIVARNWEIDDPVAPVLIALRAGPEVPEGDVPFVVQARAEGWQRSIRVVLRVVQ